MRLVAAEQQQRRAVGGFQHERDEFFAWLKETGLDKRVFLVCGDRHWQYHSIDRRRNREIHEFTGGAAQNDDITLVAIKEKVPVEERLEQNRRELFRLIDVEGMPIAEACDRLKVAPSTYYRYRRRVSELGDEAGLKPSRPSAPLARASLEEEAAILDVVKAEPLLGAKRIHELLHAARRCRSDLSERAVYATLKRHGLNRKEKRLEFARTGTDTRMARLAQALSLGERANPTESGGGDA